ncbi:MAG TPA: NADH-quinone oxidoreductase subunit C [Myxococcales bacterium]|nr:NADH-quinone oxidoreductase subunit C [Myxococcales bacterium]
MALTPEQIQAAVAAKFGDAVGPLAPPAKDPFFTVKADRLLEVCRFLKAEPTLAFDFLEDVTATDHLKENQIKVVYHLFSYAHRHGVVIKVELDRAAPKVASLEPLWKTADWLEREVYDLFGVTFEGHPDMRRIMMPDDWVGHPLRKDYQEAGGYEDISNVRDSSLVEYRRMDDAVREAVEAKAKAAAPATPSTPLAPTGTVH